MNNESIEVFRVDSTQGKTAEFGAYGYYYKLMIHYCRVDHVSYQEYFPNLGFNYGVKLSTFKSGTWNFVRSIRIN